MSLTEALLFSHGGLWGPSGLCQGTPLSKHSSVLLVKQGQPPGPAADIYRLGKKRLTWLFAVSLAGIFLEIDWMPFVSLRVMCGERSETTCVVARCS